jgi:hypothetical protein
MDENTDFCMAALRPYHSACVDNIIVALLFIFSSEFYQVLPITFLMPASPCTVRLDFSIFDLPPPRDISAFTRRRLSLRACFFLVFYKFFHVFSGPVPRTIPANFQCSRAHYFTTLRGCGLWPVKPHVRLC